MWQASWTLQPTAASQKYAPPAGFTAWDGARRDRLRGSHRLPRARHRRDGARERSDDADLRAGDGWGVGKLDALYVLAQQTQADSLLNLIGTSYPLPTAGRSSLTKAIYGFVTAGCIDTLIQRRRDCSILSIPLAMQAFGIIPSADDRQ